MEPQDSAALGRLNFDDQISIVLSASCLLLATGALGAGSLSDRLAAAIAFPNRGDRRPRSPLPGLGCGHAPSKAAERPIPAIANLEISDIPLGQMLL